MQRLHGKTRLRRRAVFRLMIRLKVPRWWSTTSDSGARGAGAHAHAGSIWARLVESNDGKNDGPIADGSWQRRGGGPDAASAWLSPAGVSRKHGERPWWSRCRASGVRVAALPRFTQPRCDGKLRTAAGGVLRRWPGKDLDSASENAYRAAERVRFDGGCSDATSDGNF